MPGFRIDLASLHSLHSNQNFGFEQAANGPHQEYRKKAEPEFAETRTDIRHRVMHDQSRQT
jgi:hypothetical protein